MNNILYSKFDEAGIMTALLASTRKLEPELIELSGMTAMEAYEKCQKIFSPLLQFLKHSIDEEYPVHHIEKLGDNKKWFIINLHIYI